MNIEQLQYMCAISQHKSITKAAESLYVTQQTVSKAIHRLEKELGFQLLVRNYNGIVLTENGKLFVERAQVILEQIQDLYYIASPEEASLSGTVTVYCSSYFIYRVASKMLTYFSKHYPKVKLHFKEELAKNIVSLVSDENRLGFITTLENRIGSDETTVLLKNLEKHEMSVDQLLVLVAKQHPLAQNAEIAIQELGNYPIVIDNLPGIETAFLQEYNTELSVLMYSSSLSPCIDNVRHNATLAFITKSVLAHYTLPDDVIALPLLPKCKAKSYFIHRKDYQPNRIELEVIKHSSRILSNF